MNRFCLLLLPFVMFFHACVSGNKNRAGNDRYQAENRSLSNTDDDRRIVLLGNSITEGWEDADPDFFKKYHLVNRGISGETSTQMLARMQQDVIDPEPVAVIILAGINDIAANDSPEALQTLVENIEAMARMASGSGISVVLCSILPSNRIHWRNNKNPSGHIDQVNRAIRSFAAANGFGYIDYHPSLRDDANGLRPEFTYDGVHLTHAGYQAMKTPLLNAIARWRN